VASGASEIRREDSQRGCSGNGSHNLSRANVLWPRTNSSESTDTGPGRRRSDDNHMSPNFLLCIT
jgi:hypothetical protein